MIDRTDSHSEKLQAQFNELVDKKGIAGKGLLASFANDYYMAIKTLTEGITDEFKYCYFPQFLVSNYISDTEAKAQNHIS